MNRGPLYLAWDARRATQGGMIRIAQRQQARLTALVDFVRRCSHYYGDLLRDLPPDEVTLDKIPPATKGALMARFGDWVTDPAVRLTDLDAFTADPARAAEPFLGRYLVYRSSGTTGDSAIFVHDRAAMAVKAALKLARGLPTWLSWPDVATFVRRGRRAAVLLLTGAHYATYVAFEHARRVQPWRRDKTRLLSVLSPLPELVRELNAFQPALLGGYATALTLLADEQAAGRLRIRPTLVVSGAESLTAEMRSRIERAFACPVRETYLASEAPLAFGCGHGWLHVNADWVIVEPVDEAYRPARPGQPSHSVLVTNLANRVQPIIRYDLGDSVLSNPGPCSCGNPLPAIRVAGRTDQILDFPGPSGATIRLLPLAVSNVVYETPDVHRYQLIQTARDRLAVRLEAMRPEGDAAAWAAVHQRLCAYLAAQGLPTVRVERVPESPAPDPRSGKYQQVWSEIRR